MDRKACVRCKVSLTMDKFRLKRNDEREKLCMECNEKNRLWLREKRCYKIGQEGYIKPPPKDSNCKHGKKRNRCIECGNKSICVHKKRKDTCRECGIYDCEHGRNKYVCKECPSASSICEHKKVKSRCVECGGQGICKHGIQKDGCRECGSGSRFCEHGRNKYVCKECPSASSICEHKKVKNRCLQCPGPHICCHKSLKERCRICSPVAYLKHILTKRIQRALESGKELPSANYLGGSIDDIIEHIEAKFEEGMTWENHGEWHIDHIIPIKYDNPTLEDQIERLQYTNLQPLWAIDNLKKGNRRVG